MRKQIPLLILLGFFLLLNRAAKALPVNIQKDGGALTASFTVPSGFSITATGSGSIIATSLSGAYPGGTGIITVGTITTGGWEASVIAGQYGGTGVANTGKTITLGGNLITAGSFAATLTFTATTNSTMPAGTHSIAPLDTPVFTTNITTPKVIWSGSVFDLSGSGTPEGAVTAAVGSVYRRTNGSTGTTLYVKETGTGNTGWAAVGGGGGSGTVNSGTIGDMAFYAANGTTLSGTGAFTYTVAANNAVVQEFQIGTGATVVVSTFTGVDVEVLNVSAPTGIGVSTLQNFYAIKSNPGTPTVTGAVYAFYAQSGMTYAGTGLRQAASSYHNFGTTAGSSGYGFRDNGGTMQVKDSGGSWANFGGGGGSGTVNSGTATQLAFYNSNGTTVDSTPAFRIISGVPTITATATNGDVVLAPDGTGNVRFGGNASAYAIADGSGKLSLFAVGTNQNVVLTASGSGSVTVPNGVGSTSTTTGALKVTGGVGISGNLWAASFDGIVGATTPQAGNFTAITNSSMTLTTATNGGIVFNETSSGQPYMIFQISASNYGLIGINNGVDGSVTGPDKTIYIRAINQAIILSGDNGTTPGIQVSAANAVTMASTLNVTGTITGASLTTGAPSGGTAAAWKLGTVASVTPTLQNRTIEVQVGGTTYYLTAKTTND